ncbi:MAG TPA: hypothetical protein DCW71_07140 [Alistipes sp.]|nr:hypothetical protein [Alistipes sp.]
MGNLYFYRTFEDGVRRFRRRRTFRARSVAAPIPVFRVVGPAGVRPEGTVSRRTDFPLRRQRRFR